MPIDYNIDEDLLLAGIDGYAQPQKDNSTFRPIYRLERGTTIVRFLTDKETMGTDHGWHIYREVAAFDGLRGGFQLPSGLKEFPVNDQIIVEDPETGEKRRQYAPRGTDPLLELVVPSLRFPPADGRVKGQDKVAVNVLTEEGRHIILKMSSARAKDLFRTFNNYREMDENFSCTQYPWALTVRGEGLNTTLTVKPIKNEPPVELPEPYDLVEVFASIRSEVEDYVRSLSDTHVEVVAEEEHDIVDAYEEAVTEAEPTDEDKYASLSDVRLKTLLTKANVSIPPRSTRSALIALATAHNV